MALLLKKAVEELQNNESLQCEKAFFFFKSEKYWVA